MGGSENEGELHVGCRLLPNAFTLLLKSARVQDGRGFQECVGCSATIRFVLS